MKTSIKKIFVTIMLVILCNTIITTSVKAIETKSIEINQELTLKLADSYNDKMGAEIQAGFKRTDNTTASEKISKVITTMVVAVKVAAVAIAIIMLLVLAMKYMMAAPGEKAEIKKHAVVYVIGAVVLFGVTGILSLIEKFSKAFSA